MTEDERDGAACTAKDLEAALDLWVLQVEGQAGTVQEDAEDTQEHDRLPWSPEQRLRDFRYALQLG